MTVGSHGGPEGITLVNICTLFLANNDYNYNNYNYNNKFVVCFEMFSFLSAAFAGQTKFFVTWS